jgi:hypothetical protein
VLDILYRLIEYIAQVKKKSVVVTILPPSTGRLVWQALRAGSAGRLDGQAG